MVGWVRMLAEIDRIRGVISCISHAKLLCSIIGFGQVWVLSLGSCKKHQREG